MKIIKGKQNTPLKVVIYGPEGIGKSTFASQFPAPLFIDTEGSTKQLDVDRLPAPTSWQMLLDEVDYAKNIALGREYQTLVIDTADWAEKLCARDICNKKNVSGIEDFGYGKGYTYLAENFGKLLNLLSDVVEAGMNVCVTAHAMMRKFEQPDEMGAYDRWELKLEKKTAPLLKEWADILLFANYKTDVVASQKTNQKIAVGGRRVLYTTHHPAWDAKNRFGLQDMVPFSFESIKNFVPGVNDSKKTPEQVQPPQPEPAPTFPMPSSATPEKTIEPKVEAKPEPPEKTAPPQATPEPQPAEPSPPTAAEADPLDALPKALRDLMKENLYTIDDLKRACGAVNEGGLGYFAAGTEPSQYPKGFFQYVVSNWAEFSPAMDKGRLPFDI